MDSIHKPVLQKEILEILNPQPGDNFIDATIDGGGHSAAILEKIIPDGKILGIDLDQELIQRFKNHKNLILICDNYINMKKIIQENNFKNIKGVLFDLGMSSWHLEKSGRGFSFQKNEPLDMRYGAETQTAEKIINSFREKELADIFWKYGEEKFSRNIAKNIVHERKLKPIQTTFDLVQIIESSVPRFYKHKKIHCATKTFQALRIFINQELQNIELVLPQALDVLEANGILTVISFHALEDRIVKNFFREMVRQGKAEIFPPKADRPRAETKKPLQVTLKERRENPRSRSAKLRALKKI